MAFVNMIFLAKKFENERTCIMRSCKFGLALFCSFLKLTRARLSVIALEIILLPILIYGPTNYCPETAGAVTYCPGIK